MSNLFDKICCLDTLKAAWQCVLQKKSRGGIDDIQPGDMKHDIDKKLTALSSDLQHGKYVPLPYAKGSIPKFNKNNEWRKLSLPSVIDKIVQQAFVLILEPLFEKEFKDCSYAYRKGKGAVKAIKHLEFYLNTTNVNWAASLDIDDFFDTMNHQRLLDILKRKVGETKIINLVSLYLKAGSISRKGDWDEPDEGISQGSVISPLLSNIYLHALDEFTVENEFKYIRYSDNFIIVTQGRDNIHKEFEQINSFIENKLFLKLNKNPYPFKNIKNGFVFLGIYFKQKSRSISNSKETKIFKELNFLTDREHQHNVDHFLIQLNSSIKGKKRYYGFINAVSQFEKFDNHLIKRLKFLLKHFIKKNMLTAKKDVVELLMKIVFFVKKKQSDKETLCKNIADEIFDVISRNKDNKNKQKISSISSSQSKKISAQQNRYLKKVADQTEIRISTPGVFVGKTSARIIVRQKRKNIIELPFSKIKNLSINTNGVSLSSDLVFLCSKNKIPITFYSYKGQPMAVLQSPMYSMGAISVNQIKTYETQKSLELTKKILKGKTTNQINLLKYYLRSRKSKPNEFSNKTNLSLEKMKDIAKTIQAIEFAQPYSLTRDRLFSAEARISAYYWQNMKLLVQPELGFEKRVRLKAGDLVNNMLNYGYGILYQRVWQAIVKEGLNPHISFLHAFQVNKPTLVYDMVEEFRQPFVDRAIFSLLTKGKKGTGLKINDKTGLLNKKTKDQVVKAVLGRLSTLINFRSKKVKCETIIELQIRNLVLFLQDKKSYKPFISGY